MSSKFEEYTKNRHTIPDYAFKMAEEIINLKPNNTVRIKMNSPRFSLFRTCYLVADEATANQLFVNSFVIPGIDWISLRCYFQMSGIDILKEDQNPVDLLPDEIREQYKAKIKTTLTVIPYYTITHEGSVEESNDLVGRKFDTELDNHFREKRTLLMPPKHDAIQHKMLDLIFDSAKNMQIVINSTSHKNVCRYCENYFRAVSGMCHFRRSERDGTLEKDKNYGPLLCSMKLLYKSELDDMPKQVSAPYEANLLSVLNTVSEQ